MSSFRKIVSHTVRVALVAGAMLLIGALAGKLLGWFTSVAGLRSGASILIGFLLVVIIGIAGGAYLSIRHVAENSIFHPVAAAALLGLFPVGVTFRGDSGLLRIAIVLGAVSIAAIAAVVIRSRKAPHVRPAG